MKRSGIPVTIPLIISHHKDRNQWLILPTGLSVGKLQACYGLPAELCLSFRPHADVTRIWPSWHVETACHAGERPVSSKSSHVLL